MFFLLHYDKCRGNRISWGASGGHIETVVRSHALTEAKNVLYCELQTRFVLYKDIQETVSSQRTDSVACSI